MESKFNTIFKGRRTDPCLQKPEVYKSSQSKVQREVKNRMLARKFANSADNYRRATGHKLFGSYRKYR
jgi:hypothetical protein